MAATELSPRYDPSSLESGWYETWNERGYFHPSAGAGPEPYTIVIPPPNITGVLHMGHALNNTLQDVFTRHQRMRGRRALYLPGTDHAGIATQNVVERELASEGLSRDDVGRDAFVARVWAWKEKYGNEIYDQLKQLGVSCDWERQRFTMDPGLSRAVREVFVRLYDESLVYRGEYIINWCPRCGTALSDEEAEKKEVAGHMYHIRYALEGGAESVIVATTRPETMLGDTGIAVHPDDDRYRDRVGTHAILPLVGRRLPIVGDLHVDPEFGTGAVKVTPAHDPNDFWIGERHGLERINVFQPDATMNAAAGEFEGLDRYEARKQIVARLEATGEMVEIEDHVHAVGHCYRCGTVVEPYLSDQWFVRMEPLARPALEAVRDGSLSITPDRWTGVYVHWLENVRDWCISRQIWWGHRIPVWTCGEGHEFAALEDPAACPTCGSESLEQDPDVLDTWFSSQLWPFSTLGWPDETDDLATFYPTDTLVTASEILFFWVARMVMMGYHFMDACPFSTVVINGTVRDDLGRRMSKSLGNGIDPREVIAEFGADALRFTLVTAAPTGRDLKLTNEAFHVGRNFANKLWNAARFTFMQIGNDFSPVPEAAFGESPERLAHAERWILNRLDETVRGVDRHLLAFRPDEAAALARDFVWHDFADWYIEWAKSALNGPHGDTVRSVLLVVLDRSLRLLHPFMPFVTEEIWQHLPETMRTVDSIMIARWPEPAGWSWPDEANEVALLQEAIQSVRNLRASYDVPPGRKAPVVIAASESSTRAVVERYASDLARMAGASETRVVAEPPSESGYVTQIVRGNVTVAVRLADLVDVGRERERLTIEIERSTGLLEAARGRLSNEQFVSRAPAEVVERERAKAVDFQRAVDRLESLRAALDEG